MELPSYKISMLSRPRRLMPPANGQAMGLLGSRGIGCVKSRGSVGESRRYRSTQSYTVAPSTRLASACLP